jgi:hypothetical protein
MNTLNEKELETTFNAICKDHKQGETPDLWPAIEAAITRKQKDHGRVYSKLSFAGAFAAIAVERLKQLLGGNFSLSLGGTELSGVLISEDGEEKELNIDGNVVKIRMSSMSESMVLIELAVYMKDEQGGLKLVSKPKIAAVKGKSAEIRVTGPDRKTKYKFKLTPETDPKTYRGNVLKD